MDYGQSTWETTFSTRHKKAPTHLNVPLVSALGCTFDGKVIAALTGNQLNKTTVRLLVNVRRDGAGTKLENEDSSTVK